MLLVIWEVASLSGLVCLLGELFSALDTLTKASVHTWYLNAMERIKLSALFITHDIDEAILLSDRVYLLTDGKIGAELEIQQKKTRREDFSLTPEFLAYKKEIRSKL